MDEYNKEFSNHNEIQKEELSPIPKNPEPKEYGTTVKAKKVAKVTSIALTVIGISLVLGSVISFALTVRTTTKVQTFNLTAEATQINYEVNITESKSDSISIKIHNQFMSRTIPIGVGEYIGSFTELTPGMQYKISVLEKNNVVKSQNITTLYS